MRITKVFVRWFPFLTLIKYEMRESIWGTDSPVRRKQAGGGGGPVWTRHAEMGMERTQKTETLLLCYFVCLVVVCSPLRHRLFILLAIKLSWRPFSTAKIGTTVSLTPED